MACGPGEESITKQASHEGGDEECSERHSGKSGKRDGNLLRHWRNGRDCQSSGPISIDELVRGFPRSRLEDPGKKALGEGFRIPLQERGLSYRTKGGAAGDPQKAANPSLGSDQSGRNDERIGWNHEDKKIQSREKA